MIQIKSLIEKNKSLMPTTNTIAYDNYESKSNSKNSNGLEELLKPEFWKQLIKLYIFNGLLYTHLFNLKYFDLTKILQSLLMSIYCWRYNHTEEKAPELTDYMDKLAQNNFNIIVFKPKLNNIKALYIQYYSYYYSGEFVQGRACTIHLTRMCHLLGIHIDTRKFDPRTTYDGSILYWNLTPSYENMATVYKLCHGFEVEIPKFKSELYGPEWQMLSGQFKSLMSITDLEAEYYSKLCILANEFRAKSLYNLSSFNTTNK